MNKVILKGNVGADPRITAFENGGKVAQFTLATTERGRKNADGTETPDITDWHNIVVKKSGLAGICADYVKKGTPLLIVGKIRTRDYQDNAGQTRYVTEIIVDEMELLGGQKREQAPDGYEPGGNMPGFRAEARGESGVAPADNDLPSDV